MRPPATLILVTAAAVLSFAAGALILRPGPAAAQQAGSTAAYGGTVSANNRFIAATGSVGSGMSVLWLVDTETKRVLVYGTNSMGKDIELRAARNIEWDVKLDYLNDDSQYKVEDMRHFAEKQAAAAKDKEKEKEKDAGSGGAPKEGQK